MPHPTRPYATCPWARGVLLHPASGVLVAYHASQSARGVHRVLRALLLFAESMPYLHCVFAAERDELM